MRIFVTGAVGFIGGHFMERALAAGHEVVGLYREGRSDRSEFVAHLCSLGARLVQGGLDDVDAFRSELKGVDCVCHFAGAFRESEADEQFFHRINVEGTRKMLVAAGEQGVRRFVFCSTAGIYGKSVDGVADESAVVRPFNSYERSKVAAERDVRERAGALDMEYVILRPGVVYGPRDERLRKLFGSAAKGRFPLFGSGVGRRPMVYVTDVADAFLKACEVPEAANCDFIISGERSVSLRELLQTIATLANRRSSGPQLPLRPMRIVAGLVEDVCQVLGIKPPIYRRRMDFYVSDAAFNCSRANRILGWKPRIELREGLARTMRFYELGTSSRPPMKGARRIAGFFVLAGQLLIQAPGLAS